jgi:UDP-N-acetyl-D-glucosamine/UDP-N-acetyl-D-galactosamine dehydrogenase
MLIAADKQIRNARIAILGLTYKEDVPDIRNTRVVDIMKELMDFGVEVLLHDPFASPEEIEISYGRRPLPLNEIRNIDAVIFAVAHQSYLEPGLGNAVLMCRNEKPIVIDIKGIFNPAEAEKLGIRYWRL